MKIRKLVFALTLDHVKPWAKGGTHSPENLRVICAKHNFHKAIKDYGPAKMAKYGDLP